MDQTTTTNPPPPPAPLPRVLRRRLTRELRDLPPGSFRILPRNTALAVIAHHRTVKGREVRRETTERGTIRVWILDTPAK